MKTQLLATFTTKVYLDGIVDKIKATYPIVFDPGSPGGVQGGDTYNLYYMPNDGSPYPRDFVINQDGIISYANNEIDTANNF